MSKYIYNDLKLNKNAVQTILSLLEGDLLSLYNTFTDSFGYQASTIAADIVQDSQDNLTSIQNQVPVATSVDNLLSYELSVDNLFDDIKFRLTSQDFLDEDLEEMLGHLSQTQSSYDDLTQFRYDVLDDIEHDTTIDFDNIRSLYDLSVSVRDDSHKFNPITSSDLRLFKPKRQVKTDIANGRAEATKDYVDKVLEDTGFVESLDNYHDHMLAYSEHLYDPQDSEMIGRYEEKVDTLFSDTYNEMVNELLVFVESELE